MTSRDPQRCCEAVRSVILATAWLFVTASDAVRLSSCKRYVNWWIVIARVGILQK